MADNLEQLRLGALQQARAKTQTKKAGPQGLAKKLGLANGDKTSGLQPLDLAELLLLLVALFPLLGPAARFLIRLKKLNAIEGLFHLINLIPLFGPIISFVAKLYVRISRTQQGQQQSPEELTA